MIHPIVKRTIAVCCTAIAGLFSVNAGADVPQSFSIYSLEETNVYDRASLNCGNIGSNKMVTIGSEAPIRGSIFAGTTLTLRDRASVNGNVTAGGAIVKGSNVVISGTQSPNTPSPTYTIPVITVNPGSQNIDVSNDGTRILSPGAFGTITVGDRAILKLSAGIYQFRSLSIGNDAHLVLDFQPGQNIAINVANDLAFGDRVIFEYPGSPDFSKVKIYSGTYNTVKLGFDMRFAAFLSAPRAKIELSDRVNFQGAVYGKYVDVKYDIKNELQIPTGEGVIAVVKKVINNGNGTYTVQFGYVNNGSKVVVVPVGINNYMTGLPGGNQDGGQVTTFYPGQVELAFSVVTDFAGSGSIGWVLYGGDPNYTTSVDADPTKVVRTDLAVIPSISKVIGNCDGTYTAFFGYTSLNSVVVRVDVGTLNYFTGTPSTNAGQPFLFNTGSHESAFSVKFSGSSVQWNLQGTSVTANASDALISCTNVQPVLTSVVENSDGSAKAVFGYNNPNQIVVNRPVTGTNNTLAGAYSNNVGQPTSFEIGSVAEAFSVNFTGPVVSWTLDGVTVTALKSAAVDRDFGMWSSSYIGGVGGNYTLKGSKMAVSVTGASGTPTNDRMYFVNYQTSANFEIKTKISPLASSIQNAGLMVRGSTGDNAEFFALKVSNTGSIVCESRTIAGTAYSSTTAGTATVNPWIRIVRNGSVFNAYISADGTTWTSAGSQTVTMPSNAFLGLCMEGNGGGAVNRVFQNVDVAFVDGNSNQIPDIVENIIGGSMTGVPRRSHWTNEGLATAVTDNYSSVTGYAHCTAVRSFYSHAEADGVILPVDQLVDAATAPVPVTPGLIVDGGKLHNITGSVKSFDKVVQAFPISAQLRGVPKELLRLDHYNTVTSQWEPVALENVTTDAAYARVKSYSYYRLSTEYTIHTATDGTSLENALSASATPPASGRHAILCQGSNVGDGTVYQPNPSTGLTAFTIPEKVLLLGGLPSVAAVGTGESYYADPKKYKSVLTVKPGTGVQQVVVNMSVTLSGGIEKSMQRTIDGFIIKNGNNVGSAWSAGGIRIVGIGGHVLQDTIRNCVIESNTGTTAGGIIVANARMTDIVNCVFKGNTQTPNAAEAAPKGGNLYGASAILLTLGGACHSETTVRNCVFMDNVASGPLYSGTVTVFGDYNMAGTLPSEPAAGSTFYTKGEIQNCTFYRNSSTGTAANNCAGALVLKSSAFDQMTVANCIIRENTPVNVSNVLTNTQITYTNIGDTRIQDVPPATSVNNNINVDAGFVGVSSATITKETDLALTISSPCKNAGKDIPNLDYDIRGYQRLSTKYDMGAYENYIKVLCVGDGNTVGCSGFTYRSNLKNIMSANGYEIDFIGPNKTVPYLPADQTYYEWKDVDATTLEYLGGETKGDFEHAGNYTNSISSMIGPNTNQPDVDIYVRNYLNSLGASDFDILLLMVGTNDVYATTSTGATIFTGLSKLVSGIHNWVLTTAPTSSLHKVIVSTLTPYGSSSVNVDAYNNKVDDANLLISNASSSTLPVDAKAIMSNTILSTAVLDGGDEGNNIFRYFGNATGCTSIANSFWTAIQAVLP
jgi:hypothetical protein